MHILLVSMCERRAIGRTAAVLDAYATRCADRTWITPITREGLQTLHRVVRAIATRQTAVACFVNDGTRGMRLAWTVGARGIFDAQGRIAVATKKTSGAMKIKQASLPPGLRMAALLARLAGYLHDLGKFGVMFQDKLTSSVPLADAVRHEWLSLHVLNHVSSQLPQDGSSQSSLLSLSESLEREWSGAWRQAQDNNLVSGKETRQIKKLLDTGPLSAWDALLYLVFTHHRLPTEGMMSSGLLSDATYIRSNALPEDRLKLTPVNSLAPNSLGLIKKAGERLAEMDAGRSQCPIYWRSVSTVARIALILADHSVSAIDVSSNDGHGAKLAAFAKERGVRAAFANTIRNGSTQRMNQELNWHLQNVGRSASDFIFHLATFSPPGLSSEGLAGLRGASAGRFAWQGHCADDLRREQEKIALPTLVFNLAGTGSGKTRMNAVAVVALRDAVGEGQSIRFTTALNLRSLTLQTKDAYSSQMGIGEAEISCVIGSAITKQLHEDSKANSEKPLAQHIDADDDDNVEEERFEVLGDDSPPPEWLESFFASKRNMRAVVMPPVLICTIDHIIKAGEPCEQGNYALTNLRLMTSDLILDEIDSYDPKALVAVMRLVCAASFWGRHVIVSSATLSKPVADGIWRAYELGANMRSKLQEASSTGVFRVAMIDDRCPTRMSTPLTSAEFCDWYDASIKDMLGRLGTNKYRPCEMVSVNPASERSLLQSIEGSCVLMHARHKWKISLDYHGGDHFVSFGLVRVANIKQAIKVAKHLDSKLAQARICCYHSQLPLINRYMLERSLDSILTRKEGSPGPQKSKDVLSAVMRSRAEGRDETIFLVIATPVEEIGRDHDFDWAIIEPSSVQSIVQTAGRVNRHRLIDMVQPNVGVLQFNFCHIERVKKGKTGPCFYNPGLEPSDNIYSTHDLKSLLDWDEISRCGQIDARVKFSAQHQFSEYDDNSMKRQIAGKARKFLSCDKGFWMGEDTYRKTPLREQSQRVRLSMNEFGTHYEEHNDGPKNTVWMKTEIKIVPELKNNWLAWSLAESNAEVLRRGLSPLESYCADVYPCESSNGNVVYAYSESLGYHRYANDE